MNDTMNEVAIALWEILEEHFDEDLIELIQNWQEVHPE